MAFFWVVVIRGNNTPFVVESIVKIDDATSVVVLTKTDPDKLVKLLEIIYTLVVELMPFDDKIKLFEPL